MQYTKCAGRLLSRQSGKQAKRTSIDNSPIVLQSAERHDKQRVYISAVRAVETAEQHEIRLQKRVELYSKFKIPLILLDLIILLKLMIIL